jgi:hypothetical protein
VPFLVASVSLAAGVILRYNMPESVEFTSNHDELDSEYHQRLQQQQAQKHQKQLRQQHQQAVSTCADSDAGAEKDAAASDTQGLPRDSAAGSERTAEGWVDESGEGGDDSSKRHYVPLLELFRGYWSGLVLHVAYAACE